MGLAEFHLITNEFSSALRTTKIKTVGVSETGLENVHKMLEYNGAVYIAKTDGLFRYNGVDVQAVLNHRENVSADNFRHMTVFNGRLYYTMGGTKLYEFDGVNITLIANLADAYSILAIQGGADRLWISAVYNETSTAIYDKGDFTGSADIYTYALLYYNGIGFYEYKTWTYQASATDFYGPTLLLNKMPMPVDNYIVWMHAEYYYNNSVEVRPDGFSYHKQDLTKEYELDEIGTSRYSTITGSLFDAGYPAVEKVLNGLMAEYEGFGDNILMVVECRTILAGVTSEWLEVWRSDNIAADGAGRDYFLHDEVIDVGAEDLEQAPMKFQRIEYRMIVTVSGELEEVPRWNSLTLRYTLQPRMRRQWLLGVSVFGKDPGDIDVQYQGDGVAEPRTAAEIRRLIYDAYENKLPVLFYDIDFSTITDDNPLTIAGRDWVKDGDYLAFKVTAGDSDPWLNRRVEYDGEADDTTLISLDKIGHRQSIGGLAPDDANAGLSVADEVRKSYAVYIRRITNERVIIDDNTINDEAGYSDLSSELVIELVEA